MNTLSYSRALYVIENIWNRNNDGIYPLENLIGTLGEIGYLFTHRRGRQPVRHWLVLNEGIAFRAMNAFRNATR